MWKKVDVFKIYDDDDDVLCDTVICQIWKHVFLQNRELNDELLITRQRAVMALCDYLHDPEHIAAALREGKLN